MSAFGLTCLALWLAFHTALALAVWREAHNRKDNQS